MDKELYLNSALPYIMHIDLNSCFAIIEQQANRLLRGKPVGVAAYDTPRGFVIAASYEAKAKGVKLGVNVEQARGMCPGIIIMTPDPAKYREAHKRFKRILEEYSPLVTPKSIDEFVLDMSGSIRFEKMLQRQDTVSPSNNQLPDDTVDASRARERHNATMQQLGNEIKQRIRESLGEWVTVNVGIGPNRFLAKYAAGFGKPDGMTLIDYTNIQSMYEGMRLVDLPGINTRFRARLRAAQIYTPLDFLAADKDTLQKRVFKSINGRHWYMRLRGYEADAVTFSRKSIGHQYALGNKTAELQEIEHLLMKLCEKTGRRLRKNTYYANGIHVYLGFVTEDQRDGPASFENIHTLRSWHHGEKVLHRLYSTQDIYEAAKRVVHAACRAEGDIRRGVFHQRVKIVSVHVFGLQPWDPEQLSIFDIATPVLTSKQKKPGVITVAQDIRSVGARKRVSDAVDAINTRYGEFVVTPATMLDMQGTILDRIAFGQVNDIA